MKTIKDLYENKVDLKTLIICDGHFYIPDGDDSAIEASDMLMHFNQ